LILELIAQYLFDYNYLINHIYNKDEKREIFDTLITEKSKEV